MRLTGTAIDHAEHAVVGVDIGGEPPAVTVAATVASTKTLFPVRDQAADCLAAGVRGEQVFARRASSSRGPPDRRAITVVNAPLRNSPS